MNYLLKSLNTNVIFIGLLATFTGVIGFVPCVINIYKTNNADNFPYITIFMALTANLLWMLYGTLKNAHASTIMGLMYFTIYIFILYVKLKNV